MQHLCLIVSTTVNKTLIVVASRYRLFYNSREMTGEYVENQRDVWHLLAFQLAVSALIALIALVVNGAMASLSALLGGLICVVPNVYFVRQLFKYKGARAAKQIVNGFYKGEALKLLLTIALFVLVFKLIRINPLFFFMAFIAAQMVFWFVPLISNNKRK